MKAYRDSTKCWKVQSLSPFTAQWETIYEERSRPAAVALQKAWRASTGLDTRLISPMLEGCAEIRHRVAMAREVGA